jgi:broad specificity phosphatase PhoE
VLHALSFRIDFDLVTIYLISHAHTVQDRLQQPSQWHLSERGVAQAAELALQSWWQTVDLVVVSSEAKTRQTVDPAVAIYGVPVWVDYRFDELRRVGWFENYTLQVAEVFSSPERSINGWEPANQALSRTLQAAQGLTSHWYGKTVVVVGHGLSLSLLRASLLGYFTVRLEDWQQLGFAAVAVVSGDGERLLSDFAIGQNDIERG